MGLISNYYITTKDEIKKVFSDKHNPIEYVKESLTVIPKKFGNSEVLPMITYMIKGDSFYLPYRWGIDNFGTSEEDVSLGTPIHINLSEEYPPRRDQIKLIDDMMINLKNRFRVLLSAEAATGKTYCAIYAICQFKVTTAIVVGKGALINQWKDRLLKFTDLTSNDIGIVKSKNIIFENKKVVLISTDSFYNRTFDDKFLRQFGFVIFDEHHNFNAQQKFAALGKLYAKYQLGMSATHDRIDGRDKVSELWFGKIDVIAHESEPIPITVYLVPIKHDIPLTINYDYFEKNNIDPRWIEITKLSQLNYRNNLAFKIINYEYKKQNYILSVSNRIEQLQDMYDKLINSGIPDSDIGLVVRSYYKNTYLISIGIEVKDIKKYKEIIKSKYIDIKYIISSNKIIAKGFKDKKTALEFYNYVNRLLIDECNSYNLGIVREKVTLTDNQIDEILYNKNKKILLATYKLLREGVSIWWMNRLIDLTPESRAEQLLGRIGRKAEDGNIKTSAICYSLYDYGNIQQRIKNVHLSRLKNYKKLKYVTVKKLNIK